MSGKCLCRGRKRGNHLPMVCCDQCDNWYHYECLGLSEKQVLPQHWFCAPCQNMRLLAEIRANIAPVVENQCRLTFAELKEVELKQSMTSMKLSDLAREVKDLRNEVNEKREVADTKSKEWNCILLEKNKATELAENWKSQCEGKVKELEGILVEKNEAIELADNWKRQYEGKVKEVEGMLVEKNNAIEVAENWRCQYEGKVKEVQGFILREDEYEQYASLKSLLESKVEELRVSIMEKNEAVEQAEKWRIKYEEHIKSSAKRARLSLGHGRKSASQPQPDV